MIAESLVKAAPLLFCALSFLLAWKAGIVNIGAEGQFLAGALAAAAVLTRVHAAGPVLLLAALPAGTLAGAAWAGAASWLAQRRGVLDVLATILLNFVAAGLVSVAAHGFLQERARTFPQSDPVPEGARLAILVPGTRVHAGILAPVVLALVLAWVLRATRAGFRVRAAGAGPRASEFAGINVRRVRSAAFLLSGAVAGLGGAVELAGVSGRLFESFSPGFGYLGLAVAVVGGFSPVGAVAAAWAFGGLNVLATFLQRRAGVSAASALVVEAGLLLAALAAPRLRSRFRPERERPA
jgi:general nucleoside transport system permease protein